MTDRDALLTAIAADPAADLPRLVFADWLDEHGEADLAAFIRADIAVAGLPAYHPDRLRWEFGAKAAAENFAWADLKWGTGSWVPESRLPAGYQWYDDGLFRPPVRCHRGFPACVGFDSAEGMYDPTPLTTPWPIDRIYAAEPAWTRSHLIPTAHTLGVRKLTLAGVPVEGLLSAGPLIPNLTSLELIDCIREEQVAAFVASEVFGRLETLALCDGVTSPRLFGVLSRSRVSLRRLTLWEVPRVRLREFLGSPAGAGLEELELIGYRGQETGLMRTVAERVASPKLVNLRLHNIFATGMGIVSLTRLCDRQPLAELHLSKCLTADHVRTLAACPGLGSLKVLELSNNRFGDDGVRAIVASEPLRGLHVLHVGFCRITDIGVRMLIESPLVENLVHLDLSSNLISPEMQAAARAAFGDRVHLGNRP